MNQTVCLINQQWQGGMNPDYSFGASLLAQIVPPSSAETIFAPMEEGAESLTSIDGQETLLRQMKATYDLLVEKNLAKVITLGGDCAVSEAPFDYLHGKYPLDLGIIWLDAHPDVSNESNSHHVHEMVLANLMHRGAKDFNQSVVHPFKPSQVLLAGLQVQDLRPKDKLVHQLNLTISTPENLTTASNWIKHQGIKRLAIHWDLDVLAPDDFYSILPAKPGLDLKDFDAAVGTLMLNQVLEFLEEIQKSCEIVGLTLAEHMPWDALRLRSGLRNLEIFS
ncbi:arginase family protein [Xylocopilactobacillus apicola]|uniref:Arginase n=1 Tax=Xylocopilactobacillus apicola TaxID=2932184 RepID=A0AAU9D8Q8_9LACO|nr:arginase family protein [Xylocopilactobacillus apicola]BDR58730.1 arginase [Xylocopilactobacillus apicola]